MDYQQTRLGMEFRLVHQAELIGKRFIDKTRSSSYQGQEYQVLDLPKDAEMVSIMYSRSGKVLTVPLSKCATDREILRNFISGFQQVSDSNLGLESALPA